MHPTQQSNQHDDRRPPGPYGGQHAAPATLRAARHEPQPTGPSPEQIKLRRNRRRLLLILGMVAVLLLTVGGLAAAWFNGSFTGDGDFDTAPKPCSVINRELAVKVVPDGVYTETGDLCSIDSPDAASGAKLTVTSNAAKREGRTSGPDVASKYVGSVFPGVGVRENNLGDEAVCFQPQGSRTIICLMRVSNLLVTVTGSGSSRDQNGQTPAAEVKAVAADIAKRLKDQ